MSDDADRLRVESLRERLREMSGFQRHIGHNLRGGLVAVAGLARMARQPLQRGDIDEAGSLVDLIAVRAEQLLRLVSDLMALAQVDGPLLQARLDLRSVALGAIDVARAGEGAGNDARFVMRPLPRAWGVASLVHLVYVELVAEALRDRVAEAVVEIGALQVDGEPVLVVRGGEVDDASIAWPSRAALEAPGVRDCFDRRIGLSFARQAVERHGGRIWATPPAPSGRAFFFTLLGLEWAPEPPPLVDRVERAADRR